VPVADHRGGQQDGIGVSRRRAAIGDGGLASSVNLSLPHAVSSGKLDVLPNAIVRRITTDPNIDRVNGAIFLDRHTRQERRAKAKVVVLAAGTLGCCCFRIGPTPPG
jgi:choline dehydrogenase-like flavoprotein